jgi:hypothetical protein
VSAIAATAADVRKAAVRVTHENQRFRHSRTNAAAIISETIGTPYKPETLRKSLCPYAVISGYARYSDNDLAMHAKAILDRALRRGRPPEKVGRQSESP